MSDEPWSAVVASVLAAKDATAQDALPLLRSALDTLDELLNAALAESVLNGSSIRSAASLACLSENAVRPRLGRSALLSSYAESPMGSVTATGIHCARRDYGFWGPDRGASPPLRFTTRSETPLPSEEPLRFTARRNQPPSEPVNP